MGNTCNCMKGEPKKHIINDVVIKELQENEIKNLSHTLEPTSNSSNPEKKTPRGVLNPSQSKKRVTHLGSEKE
jgi:hypothetical protein